MDKEKLLKALDEIKESYDAFYFQNKYDEDNTKNTHKEQFALLSKELELPLDRGALSWIKYEYDCHYKSGYVDEEAFGYLRTIIKNDGIRFDHLGKEEFIEKVEKAKVNGVYVPCGYATCCVSCKHFKILKDNQGEYYGCVKYNDGRQSTMPPICKAKELRIDLLTLINAIKNGIYSSFVDSSNKRIILKSNKVLLLETLAGLDCFFEDNDERVLLFSDYGKTWSLTKEELE